MLNSHTRRSFLRHTTLGTAGICAAHGISCGKQQKSLADRYRKASVGLLDTIITRESTAIRDAANTIARSIVARNRLFLSAETNGPRPFLPNNYPGLPNTYFYLFSTKMAHTVRKGDTVVTVTSGAIPAAGRNRGASVIGITTPSVADEYDPALFSSPALLGDLASVLIRSHLPVWDGLVKLAETPSGMLPGSGIALQTIFTALAGESYHRSGGISRTADTPPSVAAAFFSHVHERMEVSSRNSGQLANAGGMAADGIKAGGRLYVYDPRDIITRDLTFGAGVPLMIAPATAANIQKGLLSGKDTLVMALTAPFSSGDYSVLSSAIKKTDKVILFHSPTLTGETEILKEIVSLDNLSPEPDGVLSFDNGARSFLSTAGIMNTFLFWSLAAEITGRLFQGGTPPAFLMNSHLAGSGRHNADARALHKKRGW